MTEIKQYKYFTPEELKCKCGKSYCISTGHEMDDNFMQRLENLREEYAKPIILSSAYRCPFYNNLVSNTGEKGPHTFGKAVDIVIEGREAYYILELAIDFAFTGIGIKQHGNGRFIHLDTCTPQEIMTRPWLWSYA